MERQIEWFGERERERDGDNDLEKEIEKDSKRDREMMMGNEVDIRQSR